MFRQAVFLTVTVCPSKVATFAIVCINIETHENKKITVKVTLQHSTSVKNKIPSKR
jgi:hypothetical protein